jgi:predicted RecB family endonuclease
MSWEGEDRRRRSDEELGYLKATVEQNSETLAELKDMFKEHARKEQETTEELAARIHKLHEDVNVYKTVIKVLKALGWTAAFILAFKFGDIPELWGHDDD